MVKLLLVGMGGFLGSISRYIVSGLAYRFTDAPHLAIGTLSVNVLGCLAIGFLGGLADHHQLFPPEIRAMVFIGFLGGFTTYSTFGYETFGFARNGQWLAALITVGMHLVLGLGAVWGGYALSKGL